MVIQFEYNTDDLTGRIVDTDGVWYTFATYQDDSIKQLTRNAHGHVRPVPKGTPRFNLLADRIQQLIALLLGEGS